MHIPGLIVYDSSAHIIAKKYLIIFQSPLV